MGSFQLNDSKFVKNTSCLNMSKFYQKKINSYKINNMQVNRYNLREVLLSPGRYVDRKTDTYKKGKKQGQEFSKRTIVGKTKGDKEGFMDPLKNMSAISEKLDFSTDISSVYNYYKVGNFAENSIKGKKQKLLKRLVNIKRDFEKEDKKGKLIHSNKDKLMYSDRPKKIVTLGDLFVLQLIYKNLRRTRYKQMKYHNLTTSERKTKDGEDFDYTTSYYRKNAVSLLRTLEYQNKDNETKYLFGVDNVFLSLVIEIISDYHKSVKDPIRDMKRIYNFNSVTPKAQKTKGLLYYFDLMNLMVKREKHNKIVREGNVIQFDDGPLDISGLKRVKGKGKKKGKGKRKGKGRGKGKGKRKGRRGSN